MIKFVFNSETCLIKVSCWDAKVFSFLEFLDGHRLRCQFSVLVIQQIYCSRLILRLMVRIRSRLYIFFTSFNSILSE
jgi:hypothetical protein